MRYTTPLLYALLALSASTIEPTLAGQQQAAAQPVLSQQTEVPLHPGVRTGKLQNGFQYFILRNTEPKDRAFFYLANKVGSLQETDEQQGLAHFLEHMNFNGTVHFPKNALIDYLQKAGIRFGADLNAYTSFEETVYQLPLPTTDPELLQQGLLIMRDWASGALLEEEEIDQERGVILEEKRQREGLSHRLQEKTFPLLTNHSRYAYRSPIGTEAVLKNFPYSEIRKFHKDWYRPELQALIVVGDIDVDEMEKAITSQFAELQNPKNAPQHQTYPIALTGKNQFLAFTDAEVTQTSLQILYKQKAKKIERTGDYRASLAKDLFVQLTNMRLAERTRDTHTPYLAASLSHGPIAGGLESNGIQIMPKPDSLQASITAVFGVLKQISEQGFTESEISRLKTSYLASFDQSMKEYDKASSKSYMDQLLAYYLKGEPAPSFEYLYPILTHAVRDITPSEIARHATDFQGDANRDIFLVHPQAMENVPQEATIHAWIATALQQEIATYEEETVSDRLLAALPAPGHIVEEHQNSAVGTETLVLSNGIKVVLKPTVFKNDEIQITSYSPGGYSQYGLADFQSAVNATSIVVNSGLGPFNSLQLSKYLNGKNASVSPFISEIGEGIKAYCTKEDLGTAFELLYGYFTATRLDQEFNEANLQKAKIGLENRHLQATTVFSDSIATVLYNGDPRKTAPTAAKIDQINLDRALEIFRDRFADASDFTFVIVGNFDRALIDPYIKQYLATLPNLQRDESFRDNGVYPPEKGIHLDIRKGNDDKSTVAMAYLGTYQDYSEYNNLRMDALSSVLTTKLTERLREKEGGVYSISVAPSLAKNPRKRFGMNISFTTDPELVDKLVSAALEEIETIRSEGPSQEDIDKYIASKLLQSEQQLESNNFWLSYLLSSTVDGLDPARIFQEKEQIKSIRSKEVRQLAQKYLDPSHLFKFVLYPEKQD